MENSIEEDIKNAEHFIKSIKTDKEYKEENGWHGYYNKEIVELARILEHILSDYKRVLKENEKLKYKVEGQECVIETQAHNEEVYERTFKRLEKENKELKSRIPSLENGTYTGDIEGLLKLEKEIVKRDNEIKQLKEEVSQYKKIKEISENITLEDVEKAAKNYEKDYILREKVKEIAYELYYNNYKGNLDDGKFAQKMAKKLEKVLKESEDNNARKRNKRTKI